MCKLTILCLLHKRSVFEKAIILDLLIELVYKKNCVILNTSLKQYTKNC